MRRKYNPYLLPSWLRTCRGVCAQLIVPFTIFQLIRTFLFPTTFDVMLLILFVALALAIRLEWI
ncbi:hypothetical protein [Bacillus sp. 2205SS5-2]|uniref:hypothetical protein n=1 Tax=Bacillus sp. 2205SS5-2 TaxID=3109031 RepID=UPI00300510D4